MNEKSEILTWAEYAEEDYLTAKEMLKRDKPLLLTVCFHSQQCAEKYFKALLVLKDTYFPKTHDLLLLDGLCNEAGILTGFAHQDLVDLSSHAVNTRYPGNQPTLEDAREAFEIAKTIRKFSRTFIGLK